MITSAVDRAVDEIVTRQAKLILLEHPAGDLRLWTGSGKLHWIGQVWNGCGKVVQIGSVELTTQLEVQQVTFVVDGSRFGDEAMALVHQPAVHMPLRMYRAVFDERWQVIPDPVLWFSGFADAPVVKEDADSGTRTIELSAQGSIYNLVRPSGTQINQQEQIDRFPGDTGLSKMATIADQQDVWTVGSYNNFSPTEPE